MKIICLGDSFTQGFLVETCNYTRFLTKAGFTIYNLGINGYTTEDMLIKYKENMGKYKNIDWLIVFGGTNDFLNGYSSEFAYKNVKSILEMSNAKNNLLIIPPYIEEDKSYPPYKMVNEKIEDFEEKVKKLQVKIIDAKKIKPSYIDGVHMKSSFHEKLAQMISEEIGKD